MERKPIYSTIIILAIIFLFSAKLLFPEFAATAGYTYLLYFITLLCMTTGVLYFTENKMKTTYRILLVLGINAIVVLSYLQITGRL